MKTLKINVKDEVRMAPEKSRRRAFKAPRHEIVDVSFVPQVHRNITNQANAPSFGKGVLSFPAASMVAF